MRGTPWLVRAASLALCTPFAIACGGERIALGDGPVESMPPAEPDGPGGGGSGFAEMEPDPRDTGAGQPVDAGTACVRRQVSAEAVVWIGDSWLTIPGTQRTRVRDLARAAGAIGATDDYPSLAAPSTGLDAIIGQYRARQVEGPPIQVLIMDGGTWDTIIANGSAESVATVIAGFEGFLDDVSSDGSVEHIVYFLQPELPSIPGVLELRPGLRSACGASVVPCYFLDLQPLWMGHPEYTAPDGIQASEAGATVIAEAIWRIMQDNCIAQ